MQRITIVIVILDDFISILMCEESVDKIFPFFIVDVATVFFVGRKE